MRSLRRLGNAWVAFWFEPARPTNLAVCRILFFISMLAYHGHRDFSVWLDVPRIFWSPIWLFDKLRAPVFSAPVLSGLGMLWKAALALSAAGLFTRASTFLSFVLGLYLFGLKDSMLPTTSRSTGFTIMILTILAASRCGDALSLDALRRRPQPGAGGRAGASGEYTWPLRCVWLLLSFVLVSAGLSKLRHSGFAWVFSDTLATYLAMGAIPPSEGGAAMPPLGSWGLVLSRYTGLCRLAAAGVLFVEIFYPLALFYPRARWFLLPSACAMLVFFYLLLGPPSVRFAGAHIFWVPWDQIGRRIRQALVGRRSAGGVDRSQSSC